MTTAELLFLLFLFQLKHFLADYAFQTGWMVTNKGRYGHPGGLAHAGLHALLTIPVLLTTAEPILAVVVIAVIEWVVHYHIDWTKSHLTRRAGLTPAEKAYWTLSGADQGAHQLTYVAILWYLIA